MRPFIRPALLVTCFAPRPKEAGEPNHPYLQAMWSACRALGMTSPVAGAPAPLEVLPPGLDHDQEFTSLGIAVRASTSGLYSAFAFTEHDVTGLVALLAPNETQTGLEGWNPLLREWTDALTGTGPVPSSEGILHEFRIFEALYRGRGASGRRTHPEHIRRDAPSGRNGTWWQGFDETDEGFRIWNADGYDSPDPLSALYVLAPVRHEDTLDAWAWALPGHQGLRPLTRYLIHAAKVRYEERLYASSELVHTRVDRGDAETEALLRVLAPTSTGRPVSLERIRTAAAHLDRGQFGPQGLLWTITEQRQLVRTVSIAVDNLRIHTPGVRRHGPGSTWPEAELAVAQRVIRQVEGDQVQLEACRERADAARTLASGITERALNEHRVWLTLVQTSVLGAILTALTVVQAFQYTPPLSQHLKSPVILLLASLALALPLLVLRSARTAVSTPYRWLDASAVVLLGVAAGWTAVVEWNVHYGHAPVPFVATVPSSGAGGLLAYGAYHCWDRRRSRPY
ncbi:CATRA conflict system CASPASE/TPR repeat-associated protein [Streptomyces sp. NPDC048643]|uniref:CATRA conflict system CASPASE/TPR repeat-associated protein n=1 Tax=Streptomyces sp. NPDC048643 TaxID=3155637 RepID=UPI003416C4FB